MRVLYFGTGEIGLPALRFLLKDPGCEVVGVYTQPDKPVGRKQVITPPIVKTVAMEQGIPVFQPERIRRAVDEIVAARADLIVVMAYGQILPKAILDAPRLACLNLHASLLPKYRGASPIQAAVAAGDAESGVTVMHMDVGLDTGDVLLKHPIPIRAEETGQSLHDALAEQAPVALQRALELLREGEPPREPQVASEATHCGKLTRENGRIDWRKTAKEIERLVRAYEPWPGTWTTLNGKVLKIFPLVEVVPNQSLPPGRVGALGDGTLMVGTADGGLLLREIQLEGKKRMRTPDFLAGNSLPEGQIFGE